MKLCYFCIDEEGLAPEKIDGEGVCHMCDCYEFLFFAGIPSTDKKKTAAELMGCSM